MIKKYFQLDNIISIKFTTERESEYRWRERIPERDKKFLGFVVGKHPEIPEGWTSGNFGYLTYDDEKIRVDSSYFERYSWYYRDWETDRKSTRLNSSHSAKSRMPSSA